ncbi:MAG: LytR C-terminal domain-containing protein [Acidobacteriota bacterium]|nr:LytR C-terminal domain-containing protein [Acidobacteriota bacterium]
MNRPAPGRGRPDSGVQWGRALGLIAVLVIVGVIVLAKTHGPTPTATSTTGTATHHGSTTTSTLATSTTTTALLPASQVKVQVLNGLKTGLLASQWTQKIKTQFGYITEPPDDATVTVPASIIYVLTPGYQAEAQKLATSVGLTASAVYPTVPPPASAPIPTADRAAANLVLVIGPDLAATS